MSDVERDERDGAVETLSIDEANDLVLENQGWAESIARSVARSWNLDWQLDGLDGAAMEALIFCSRRFKPGRGVPFRGYARRRIHEAATEAARKSRGWKRGLSTGTKEEQQARDISAELFNIFPELREGHLPDPGDDHGGGGGGEDDVRAAIRQLLMGASLIAARQGANDANQEELLDYKRMVEALATLEPVHQVLLAKVYWDGLSLRNVAVEWETDGLNVMREHKVLLAYLNKSLALGRSAQRPKVRPGLKAISLKLKRQGTPGPFSALIQGSRMYE